MSAVPAAAPVGRRLFLVGALAVASAALAFVAFGNIGDNLVYYWDVGQLKAAGDRAVGATVRLGGVVKPGSVRWQPELNALAFEVTDGAIIVPVQATGAPPQMFREGIGVVVEGTMTPGGTFTSSRLMVKHSNEYKAPEAGMSAEERTALYETVEGL